MNRRCKINDRGLTLVELLVVIAIMAIVVGATAINISIMGSKDIEKAARIIEQELALLKMTAKVNEGNHYAIIDNNPDSRTITLSREIGGVTVELSQEDLPKEVKLTLNEAATPFIFLKITYNKADGTIKDVTPFNSLGSIGPETQAEPITTIECSGDNGKSAQVTIIQATGKQFIEY